MSRIDDLIADRCPGGVPFRAMWEITTWDKRFNAVDRSKQPSVRKYRYLLATEMTPFVIEGGDVKLLTTNMSNLWTTEQAAGGPVHEAEVIAIPWGGNAIVQYFNGRFVTSDNRIAVANDAGEIDMKFLYYFIQNNLDTLASFYRGSGIKHPSMAKVLDWPIPVPPLEVQREIVRVLDQFTQLEAELEAELQARTRQYDHYREQVLAEAAEGANRVEVGQLGRVVTGRTPKSSDASAWGTDLDFVTPSDIKNGMKFIGGTARHLSVEGAAAMSKARIPAGSLLVTCIGADMGKTVVNANDCITNQQINAIVPEVEINIGYMFHVLTEMREQLRKQGEQGGGTMPLINKSAFSKIEVPLPDLVTQRVVADKLNKFDALVNDISAGLPAELAARRKQYEYYRDKLVTFKEAAA